MGWKQSPDERFVLCNGKLMQKLRNRLGLSQQEFSDIAGYAKRTIAKAEAGESMHADTIEDLADALSTEKYSVTPEELSCFPKDIVRHIIESFAKYERQCVHHCKQFLSPDMKVIAPGDPEMFPFSGEHETIDGFDQFWGKYFQVMERYDKLHIAKTMQLVSEGNLVVAVVKEAAVHKRGSNAPLVPCPLTFLFHFERGKLVTFEDHFDAIYAEKMVRKYVGQEVPSPENGQK